MRNLIFERLISEKYDIVLSALIIFKKEVIKVSQNEIPRDKDGVPLKIGDTVVAEIIKEPPKAKIGGREFFLVPRVRRICGKLVIIRKRKSWIQPETGGLTEEVPNDRITVVV